jgi:hypothetical protein
MGPGDRRVKQTSNLISLDYSGSGDTTDDGSALSKNLRGR